MSGMTPAELRRWTAAQRHRRRAYRRGMLISAIRGGTWPPDHPMLEDLADDPDVLRVLARVGYPAGDTGVPKPPEA